MGGGGGAEVAQCLDSELRVWGLRSLEGFGCRV